MARANDESLRRLQDALKVLSQASASTIFDPDATAGEIRVHHLNGLLAYQAEMEEMQRIRRRNEIAKGPKSEHLYLCYDLDGNGSFDHPFEAIFPDLLEEELKRTLLPLLNPGLDVVPPRIFYIRIAGTKILVDPARRHAALGYAPAEFVKNAPRYVQMVKDFLIETLEEVR